MRSFAKYENKNRGTFVFPIERYHVDLYHPRYEMPFHWHMECEFVLMQQGGLTLLLDSVPLLLEPGDCAFIPSGVIHGGFPREKNTIYDCIVVDLEHFLKDKAICSDQFSTVLGGGSFIQNGYSGDSHANQIIHQLFNEMLWMDPGYEFIATGLLWEFIGSVLRDNMYHTPSEEDRPAMQRADQIKAVLNRIRHDYQSPLTLDELSAEANMSSKYFCRAFRFATGRTPIDYLNYYRIERAAEQLYASNESITSIALQSGFNDLSYFSRMFKKYKSISPAEYRKQLNFAFSAPLRI